MSGQRAVQIAAKLYATRDAARSLLGKQYAARMKEYGDVINKVMEVKKVTALDAATLMCKEITNPFLTLQVLAAAVELVEPSEAVPQQ